MSFEADIETARMGAKYLRPAPHIQCCSDRGKCLAHSQADEIDAALDRLVASHEQLREGLREIAECPDGPGWTSASAQRRITAIARALLDGTGTDA